jgi:hypothetical protein
MFQSLQNYYPGKMKHYMFPTMVVHGEIMRKFFQVRADFRGETDISISEMFVPVNTIGNPPALPGDSKTLSFAGVLKYL